MSLDAARGILADRFGHARFRVHQLKVLGPLLAGRNVLAVLPTGAGKSLCYQVPALLREGLTLVVSPLISLMQDQVGALRRRGIAAAYVNSQLDASQRRVILDPRARGLHSSRSTRRTASPNGATNSGRSTDASACSARRSDGRRRLLCREAQPRPLAPTSCTCCGCPMPRSW